MDKIIFFLKGIGKRQDLMLAVMMMAAVLMMVLPVPTEIIDILLSFNLTFAVLLLMIAVYINGPLEFSIFPSLLLLTTLFRLSLIVSTSRLILLQHDAGHVVDAFGNFVVGGNLIVGLIVFLIICVIQFIVIVKGSERVAEVSARFSLDGMPGKQMSIDGDMRAGVIDAQEAKFLRGQVQKESQLYGAMDGAMKFVKGDAIASLVVVVINLIGGLCVGVFLFDMDSSEALRTYAILSVGSALLDQIPGLVISITAGIIVTRIPDEDKQNLGKTVVKQLTSKPMALVVATILVVTLAAIPGFPFINFAGLGAAIAAILIFSKEGKEWIGKIRGKEPEAKEEEAAEFKSATPLSVKIAMVLSSEKKTREKITKWMTNESKRIGFPLPEIEISFEKQQEKDNNITILLYGTPVLEEIFAETECITNLLEKTLTKENIAFRKKQTLSENLVLFWVAESDVTEREDSENFIIGEDIIFWFLAKIIDRYSKEFIGIQETRYLIDSFEEEFTELLKEVQRQLSIGQIAEIFQRLVAESISLKNLRSIFESLVEWSQKEKEVLMLTEYVRISLQRYLSYTYSNDKNEVFVFMVGDKTEQMIREAIRQTDSGSYLALNPEQSKLLINTIGQTIDAVDTHGEKPVFLTSIDVRRYLRKLTETVFYDIPVLSFQELSSNLQVNVLATV